MASIQFSDVQARPTEFLDMTSLTLDEFQQLVPPFEAAFQAHMAAWRLDGKPRTAVAYLSPADGSVAKLGFGGKIRKSDLRKSMACEFQLSCFR